MQALIPVLNHIIAQNPAAQSKLSAHAGKSLSLNAAAFRICGIIGSEGFLSPCANADAVITFRNSAVQKILQGGTPGVGDIELGGDTVLGMDLLPVVGSLRYHADADFRRLFGAAAADTVGTRAAAAGNTAKKIGGSLMEQLAEFALEPESPVVSRQNFDGRQHEIAQLRDDAARLEARLAKLERTAGQAD